MTVDKVHISAWMRFTRRIIVLFNGVDITDLCVNLYASPNPGEVVFGWAETIAKDDRGQIMVTDDHTEIVTTYAYGLVMWKWVDGE